MPLEWLFQWWNAVYTVPLAVVLILLTVSSTLGLVGGALGELTDGDAHAEVDHDVDVDADVDADFDVDSDLDLDADLDGDVDAHPPVGQTGHAGHGCALERSGPVHPAHHSGPGPFLAALMFLGAGRAPVFMLLQVMVLLWGIVGISIHQAVHAAGPETLVWSVPASLLVSVLGTRSLALLFGRFFKQHESYAVGQSALVGRTGKVVYQVTSDEGTVSIRDQYGTLHRVRARAQDGALDSGKEIIVLGYDPERKLYLVDDSETFLDRA